LVPRLSRTTLIPYTTLFRSEEMVEDAPLRVEHPAEREDARQRRDGPGNQEERGEDPDPRELEVQDPREEERQDELHVDGEPHVPERVDYGLAEGWVREERAVAVGVEGVPDTERHRVDHERREEGEERRREEEALRGAGAEEPGDERRRPQASAARRRAHA